MNINKNKKYLNYQFFIFKNKKIFLFENNKNTFIIKTLFVNVNVFSGRIALLAKPSEKLGFPFLLSLLIFNGF